MNEGQWCRLCKKATSKGNLLRHCKSHHLFCKQHFVLHPKAKSKCFGIRLIKKGKMYRFGNDSEAMIETIQASITLVFVPIEMRTDTWKALTMILSSRALIDQQIHAPFFYMAALLRSECLLCQVDLWHVKESDDRSLFVHTCHEDIHDLVNREGQRVFNLFGLELDEKSKASLFNFLHSESEERKKRC